MSDVAHHAEAPEVLVLLFEQVELLDFAGPFEVLAVAGRPDGPLRFRVRAVGVNAASVRTRCGPTIVADAMPDELEHATPRVLIVPGGSGVRALLDDEPFLARLVALHERGTIIASVCTGAWLLAKAGLLDGRRATTHHLGADRLRELAPTCTLLTTQRVVDEGDVITSGGISAGIELGLHLVARLADGATADTTARYIEWEGTR